MNANNFTIRQPLYALVVFIVLAVVILFAGVFFLLETMPFIVRLLAVPFYFFLFGPFYIILWLRWKITVKDKQITYTSLLGGKKVFALDYITSVKYGAKSSEFNSLKYIEAYHEDKTLFVVPATCPGFQTLVQRLQDEGFTIEWQKEENGNNEK